MHGGAKGSGGPPGQRNGAWKDGSQTNERKALRRRAAAVLRAFRSEQGGAGNMTVDCAAPSDVAAALP